MFKVVGWLLMLKRNFSACRCCTGCGRVLADDAYSKEVTFTKGVDGSVWHFLSV